MASVYGARHIGRAFGFAGVGLGDSSGPDALAQAAQAILDALPAGSGTSPIGSAAYPAKIDGQDDVSVVDPILGPPYTRYVPYYQAHPAPDASGLLNWTGTNSAEIAPNLTQAQHLAAMVLLSHGDTSWSADFHPTTQAQYAAPQNTAPTTTPAFTDPVDTYKYTEAPPPTGDLTPLILPPGVDLSSTVGSGTNYSTTNIPVAAMPGASGGKPIVPAPASVLAPSNGGTSSATGTSAGTTSTASSGSGNAGSGWNDTTPLATANPSSSGQPVFPPGTSIDVSTGGALPAAAPVTVQAGGGLDTKTLLLGLGGLVALGIMFGGKSKKRS